MFWIFKKYRIKNRIKAYISKWNDEYTSKIGIWPKNCTSAVQVKVRFLRELESYINNDQQISYEDWQFVCSRNSFDNEISKYLYEMLKYVGLGEKLDRCYCGAKTCVCQINDLLSSIRDK